MLRGEKPDRLPFIDRLELWYSSHSRAGTLPKRFDDRSTDASSSLISVFTVPVPKGTPGLLLTDIHRDIGFGQQIQTICHARRFRGVELVLKLDGETFYHEKDPLIEYFPRLFDKLQRDKPGETTAEFVTPLGTLTTKTVLTPEIIEQGGVPLMTEHPFKDVSDYPAFEYLFEHAEFVPRFDTVRETQEKLGDIGFVIPLLNRIPFQQLVLDHIGEVDFFYMIYDHPDIVDKLMTLLDTVILNDLEQVKQFEWPYIQFDDNLDGFITNPRLFEKYCLLNYQRYSETLHGQSKKVGSHTDGNLKPLLSLLADCGLDVAESFSPAPLTECTFDNAWEAWQETGPMIWGGIPSPLLEPHTSEEKFHNYIDHLFETVGNRGIILGIGDMVMPNNSVERLRYIAERIETHKL
jgi:hypothetical protein